MPFAGISNRNTATVYEWIQKYTPYVVDSATGYHPKVGDSWVADETVLDIDGQNVWFWDVIDEKTRFLLASRLSFNRTTKDAELLMEQAAERAGKTPKVIVTDKLRAYLDGVQIAFGGDTEHLQGGPFALENNSNLIERFHGTLKARTKTMRGLKNIESAMDFTDGWLVYYNYLRPHESLERQTPAKVAGIAYPYQNWADLTRKHIPTSEIVVGHLRRGTSRLPETRIGRPRKHKRRTAGKPATSLSVIKA